MKEIERKIKQYLDNHTIYANRHKEHSKDLTKIIEQNFIKDIKKRIKSLRNRRNYLRRKDSWQTIGEPSTLRDIANYLEAQFKKGLK